MNSLAFIDNKVNLEYCMSCFVRGKILNRKVWDASNIVKRN